MKLLSGGQYIHHCIGSEHQCQRRGCCRDHCSPVSKRSTNLSFSSVFAVTFPAKKNNIDSKTLILTPAGVFINKNERKKSKIHFYDDLTAFFGKKKTLKNLKSVIMPYRHTYCTFMKQGGRIYLLNFC